MARKQVAHKVMVCIVSQCPRCEGTGKCTDEGYNDGKPRDCPVCRGTGGGNEEIPLGDLVAMIASSLHLEARLVQKVGNG